MPVTRKQSNNDTQDSYSECNTTKKKEGRGRPPKSSQYNPVDDFITMDGSASTVVSYFRSVTELLFLLLTFGCSGFFADLFKAFVDSLGWIILFSGADIAVRPKYPSYHLGKLYDRVSLRMFICFVLLSITGDFISDTIFTSVPALNYINRPITNATRSFICYLDHEGPTDTCPYLETFGISDMRKEDQEHALRIAEHSVFTQVLVHFAWNKATGVVRYSVGRVASNAAHSIVGVDTVNHLMGTKKSNETGSLKYIVQASEVGGLSAAMVGYNLFLTAYDAFGLSLSESAAIRMGHVFVGKLDRDHEVLKDTEAKLTEAKSAAKEAEKAENAHKITLEAAKKAAKDKNTDSNEAKLYANA